jgi:hypothetical protein
VRVGLLSCLFLSGFPTKAVWFPFLLHACYMTRLFHLPCIDHSNYTYHFSSSKSYEAPHYSVCGRCITDEKTYRFWYHTLNSILNATLFTVNLLLKLKHFKKLLYVSNILPHPQATFQLVGIGIGNVINNIF